MSTIIILLLVVIVGYLLLNYDIHITPKSQPVFVSELINSAPSLPVTISNIKLQTQQQLPSPLPSVSNAPIVVTPPMVPSETPMTNKIEKFEIDETTLRICNKNLPKNTIIEFNTDLMDDYASIERI